jgi:hypothetical protein
MEFPRLSAADVFESITVNPADANGHITVVCTGLKPAAVQDLIGLLRLPLESLELVSPYTLDEEGDLLRDLKQAEDQCRTLLLGLSAGSLTVTLTESSTGALRKLEVLADFDATLDGVEVEYEVEGRATFDYTQRHIAPEEGMGSYKQAHWRAVFDFLNAEAVGLIPDAEGVYHITATNSPVWDEQIHYVMDHPDELLGKTFHIVGYYWGLGGQWPQDRYATSIHGSNKNGFCIYAPIIMPYDMFEANRSKLQNSNQTNPKMEIYATLTIDDLSLDGTSKGPIFAVERIVFPE